MSRQCGAAVLLKRFEQRQLIAPLVTVPPLRAPLLRYSNRKLQRAEDLQRFLNTFPGVSLRVDGYPGGKTSDAFERVFGQRLSGDPRD